MDVIKTVAFVAESLGLADVTLHSSVSRFEGVERSGLPT